MREYEFRYLNNDVVNQITAIVDGLVAAGGKQSADDAFAKVTANLPVEKMNPDTVRRRVEGFYYTSELLFKRLLQTGRTRPNIVKEAGLKPLSHYHYLTGSREPKNLLLTRDDYLNDPSTALIKLKEDIIAVANLLLKVVK